MRKALSIPGLAGALALAVTGFAAAAQAGSSAAGASTNPSSALAPSAGSKLEEKVGEALRQGKALREVRASAGEDTGTLRGSVARAAERTRAEQLASSVSGVATVENEIRAVSARGVSSPPRGDE